MNEVELRQDLDSMTVVLRHRGPDDEGHWTSSDGKVALGFRRLAIVDLTPTGHQPMSSASGRFVIAFNGEVYNHRELREELASLGHAFRGTSDTEVILTAFDRWGVRKSIERFWGMFAFAAWDDQNRRLHLCRDRLGKKPLYYGWQGDRFLFGSELKALRANPRFEALVDPDVVASYSVRMCVPGHFSIFKGIYKVPLGTLLTIDLGAPGDPEQVRYWDPTHVVTEARAKPFPDPDSADRALEDLLLDSVRRRTIADVPIGALLSGGIDSSLIVSLMQRVSSRPVKTFTIGFSERGYDESADAEAVAKHIGTEHSTLFVEASRARDVIPDMPVVFDEPFADDSQLPTYLVSRLAREHVTVALTGDGGDELFGGYNRYLTGERLLRVNSVIPRRVRSLLSTAVLALAPEHWDRLVTVASPMFSGRLRSLSGDRIHKLARVFPARTDEQVYLALCSAFSAESDALARSANCALPSAGDLRGVERMMYLDLVTYLVDDILVKVDRASMAASLEVRSPLLDHRVVEFAWRLPLSFKLRDGVGKLPLRRLLQRYVPARLTDRPKMGFGLPVDHWLRGDLREWAESLLCLRSLRESGAYRPGVVRRLWEEHVSGKRNWQRQLWTILMYQAWWSHSPVGLA